MIKTLKQNGTIHWDSQTKSEIANAQFKSIFTPSENVLIPHLNGTLYQDIRPLQLVTKGMVKLWKISVGRRLQGVDDISCKILYELMDKMAPVLCCIYTQSIQLGEFSWIWIDANVTSLFIKENRHITANYRPVSLTCIAYTISAPHHTPRPTGP